MCTNVNVHTITKIRSPFFLAFVFLHLNVLCLLMIHVSHYIISYLAMLIGYVWPLNLLTNYASIVLKRNLEKKHLNIYQSTMLSTMIFIHTISVTDSFLLQIYIYKHFIFKYLMIRCF